MLLCTRPLLMQRVINGRRLCLQTSSGSVHVHVPAHGVTPDFVQQRHRCFYLLSRGLSNWLLICVCVCFRAA